MDPLPNNMGPSTKWGLPLPENLFKFVQLEPHSPSYVQPIHLLAGGAIGLLLKHTHENVFEMNLYQIIIRPLLLPHIMPL